MKVKILPFAISVFALLCFASCQKEYIQPAESIFSAEDYLHTSVKQNVLFQYEFINSETGEHYGWFIDRTGAVKSYDLRQSEETNLPGRESCSPTQMNNLYGEATANHLSLSAEEVVENFKQISVAAAGQYSDRVEHSGVNSLAVFRAFHEIPRQIGHSSCGNTELGTDPTNPTIDCGLEYQIVLLKASGSYDLTNESEAAKAIVEWLESVQNQAGL